MGRRQQRSRRRISADDLWNVMGAESKRRIAGAARILSAHRDCARGRRVGGKLNPMNELRLLLAHLLLKRMRLILELEAFNQLLLLLH